MNLEKIQVKAFYDERNGRECPYEGEVWDLTIVGGRFLCRTKRSYKTEQEAKAAALEKLARMERGKNR